jgi:hypothetical protein
LPRPSPDPVQSGDGPQFPVVNDAKLEIDEILAEGLERYLHAYKRVSPAEVAPAVPGEWVANAANIGPAETCRSRLAEYVAAGVTQVIVDSPQDAALLRTAHR